MTAYVIWCVAPVARRLSLWWPWYKWSPGQVWNWRWWTAWSFYLDGSEKILRLFPFSLKFIFFKKFNSQISRTFEYYKDALRVKVSRVDTAVVAGLNGERLEWLIGGQCRGFGLQNYRRETSRPNLLVPVVAGQILILRLKAGQTTRQSGRRPVVSEWTAASGPKRFNIVPFSNIDTAVWQKVSSVLVQLCKSQLIKRLLRQHKQTLPELQLWAKSL